MLITLVIIGIVAALTIPTVVVKYQKHQVETKFTKVYNTLSTALSLAQAEYGDYGNWNVLDSSFDDENASEEYYNAYLKPYLKVSKYCGRTSDKGCDYSYSYPNSTSKRIPDDSYTRFYLNDGTFIAFYTAVGKVYTYCSTKTNICYTTVDNWGTGTTGNLEYKRMTERANVKFLVDINGDKGPNVRGKDVFWFTFYHMPTIRINKDGTVETEGQKGKFVGDGYADRNEAYNACKSYGDCSDLIIFDGWKLKDDYPWF